MPSEQINEIEKELLTDYVIATLPPDKIKLFLGLTGIPKEKVVKNIILLEVYTSLINDTNMPLEGSNILYEIQAKNIRTNQYRIKKDIAIKNSQKPLTFSESQTPLNELILEILKPLIKNDKLRDYLKSKIDFSSYKLGIYLDELISLATNNLKNYTLSKLNASLSLEELIVDTAVCFSEERESLKKADGFIKALTELINDVNLYKSNLDKQGISLNQADIYLFNQINEHIATNFEKERLIRQDYYKLKKSELGYQFDLPAQNLEALLNQNITGALELKNNTIQRIKNLSKSYRDKYVAILAKSDIKSMDTSELKKIRYIYSTFGISEDIAEIDNIMLALEKFVEIAPTINSINVYLHQIKSISFSELSLNEVKKKREEEGPLVTLDVLIKKKDMFNQKLAKYEEYKNNVYLKNKISYLRTLVETANQSIKSKIDDALKKIKEDILLLDPNFKSTGSILQDLKIIDNQESICNTAQSRCLLLRQHISELDTKRNEIKETRVKYNSILEKYKTMPSATQRLINHERSIRDILDKIVYYPEKVKSINEMLADITKTIVTYNTESENNPSFNHYNKIVEFHNQMKTTRDSIFKLFEDKVEQVTNSIYVIRKQLEKRENVKGLRKIFSAFNIFRLWHLNRICKKLGDYKTELKILSEVNYET